MKDKIIKFIKTFFEGLEIDIISLDIVEENGDFYFIKLKSEDSSLIIWPHWKTIESLQRILSMCVNNFSDDKIKIKLEVNDYCKSYEDRLFSRVEHSIISLKNNWWEYDLWNLSPYDRKRVHAYVARNFTDIISKSRWEGEKRKIFLLLNNKNSKIKPKKLGKLTIDIDGDSI